MRVRIDPNIRVQGNRTLADFDDVEGFDASNLHVGEAVTVYEAESGLRGMGSVVEVDPGRRLVVLDVDWSSLRPEEAWADWDAQVAVISAGAEERRKQPLAVDDIEALLAKLRASCYEYVPPVISPNVAKLLGIPLDDPDVMPEIDETDCAHGCNGDCFESGSDVCTSTCHERPSMTP